MIDLLVRKININWDEISKDSYLKGIKSINSLEELKFSKPITFFVGENGSGKSTLLEAIAISLGFNAEGGTKNYRFSTFETHSELHNAMTVEKGFRKISWGYFLRAESMYNVGTQEIEYMGGVLTEDSMHLKSHGECFLDTMISNIKNNGLYIYDEPEAALSPQRQLSLLVEMQEAIKIGCQFIVVTHSPILLSMPNAEIFSFDDDGLKSVEYEDTESYQITEMLINRREQLFRNLL